MFVMSVIFIDVKFKQLSKKWLNNILFLNSDVPKLRAFEAGVSNLTKICDVNFSQLTVVEVAQLIFFQNYRLYTEGVSDLLNLMNSLLFFKLIN
jgi:hypothetical protein